MRHAPDSFEVIALPLMPDVSRFAYGLTRDADEADDLVQDTFLKAFRAWSSFTPGTECRSWLFMICKNTFRRRFKREGARARVESEGAGDDDALPTVLSHITAEQMGLGDLFDRLDVRPVLENALTELPDSFRSVVILIDLEGLSYREAAEVLEVPVGTVRSRLFRARRRLQESLIDQARDMGLGSASRPEPTSMADAMSETHVEFPPDCEEVVRALWDFLDSELDDETTRRISDHLEACEFCLSHADFERRLVSELAGLRRQYSDPRVLRDRVEAALRRADRDA